MNYLYIGCKILFHFICSRMVFWHCHLVDLFRLTMPPVQMNKKKGCSKKNTNLGQWTFHPLFRLHDFLYSFASSLLKRASSLLYWFRNADVTTSQFHHTWCTSQVLGKYAQVWWDDFLTSQATCSNTCTSQVCTHPSMHISQEKFEVITSECSFK